MKVGEERWQPAHPTQQQLPNDIAKYLTEALETDDAAFFTAIKLVAQAQVACGAVAESAGVDQTNFHRALSGDAKPEFETIQKVLSALGMRLVARPSE